jgi:bisphosphoglycerate-dependent phosphoglycerate mutase
MYGALQGKNKSETAAKYGEDQVKVSFFLFLILLK